MSGAEDSHVVEKNLSGASRPYPSALSSVRALSRAEGAVATKEITDDALL